MTHTKKPFPELDLFSDSFTEDELSAFLEWYSETHGEGSADLTPFVTFLVQHDPGSFKRFRRYVQSMIDWPGQDMLPRAASPLIWLHHYFRVGNGPGSAYETIAARSFGASKDLVLDVLRVALATSGPIGWNGAAGHLDQYLREWEDAPVGSVEWPEGWHVDRAALRSGIDLESDGMTDEEHEILANWYRRVCGEVPTGVTVLAEHNPRGLKAYRNRIEKSLGEALPVEMAVLLMLHSAAMGSSSSRMRRARAAAAHFGVEERHVVEVLGWATINSSTLSALGDVVDASDPS